MKHFIIILIFLLSFSVACKKDFLDEKPYSAYTPDAIKDSLGLEASMVGVYNHVSTFFTWSDQQGWLSVWQVGTDVANATNNQQGVEIPYYNYSLLTPDDIAAARMWNRCYILINLANTIVTATEDPSVEGLSVAGRNRVSAEAKFFRAWAYNTLATLYGGVPIITQPLTGPKTDFVRAPVTEVNNLIEEDLTFAVNNLPDVTTARPGRGHKYMAMQLLAEAYLRIGKYDLAEQQAQTVISSGRFSLIKARYGVKANLPGDYYSDMFVYGNQRRTQGNTEAIWVLEQEYSRVVPGGSTDNAQHRRVWGAAYHNVPGMVLSDSTGGRALGRLRLSNWVIYRLYANNDIRNSQYNLRRRYYYNDATRPETFGKPVPYTGPDTLFNLAPHTTKWYQFDPNDTFGFIMIKDFILMRLGETYLLLAEAQARQGKTLDAANSINKLRERAFVNYPASGQVSASDITLDFILDERARELIGEENRRMTLMRTGTLVERAIRLNSNDAQKPISGLSNKNLLLPIPLREIQLNKDAVLDQNDDY